MSFERLHPSTAATVTKTKQRPSLLPHREVRRVDSRSAPNDDRPFNKLTFHSPSARAIDKVVTHTAYLATNSQTIWQKKQVRPEDADGIHA
ncbi:hypothetical protein RBSWK_04630 [Rhodopirellula baltica SWK14]|uniref:Uncharacterized protein n=1 Tax=Rhodopirellula baltica SWK14 TaxID=993516 RepID=L7CCZ8_RHOBT|nr:hypothetical protein RBSWK_04630 [Rhodopirellula baltica SWK14]